MIYKSNFFEKASIFVEFPNEVKRAAHSLSKYNWTPSADASTPLHFVVVTNLS